MSCPTVQSGLNSRFGELWQGKAKAKDNVFA